MLRRRSPSLWLVFFTIASGCIPYTVGHTARPARRQEKLVTTSAFFATQDEAYTINRVGPRAKAPPMWNYIGIDAEMRTGIGERTDVGVRVTSASGAVLTFMRRLDGPTHKQGPSISALVGGGIVAEISRMMLEGSLLASGDENGRFTPYGGIRYIATSTFGEATERDTPTYGALFGVRIGKPEFGISPEIGVFRDRPLKYVTRKNYLIVPSVSFHGNPVPWMQRQWDAIRRKTGER